MQQSYRRRCNAVVPTAQKHRSVAHHWCIDHMSHHAMLPLPLMSSMCIAISVVGQEAQDR
jgi:hypothetical protein